MEIDVYLKFWIIWYQINKNYKSITFTWFVSSFQLSSLLSRG